jgi:hypothetical protein
MVRRNARCVGIVLAITDKKGEDLIWRRIKVSGSTKVSCSSRQTAVEKARRELFEVVGSWQFCRTKLSSLPWDGTLLFEEWV